MGTKTTMAAILSEKINCHKGLISKARNAGNAAAVTAANRRIRQLKKDLARERERVARAA